MSDGPYKFVGVQKSEPWRRICYVGPGIEEPLDLDCPWERTVEGTLNTAYAEGFKAGRASRDNLVEAARGILCYLCPDDDEGYKNAVKALQDALGEK